MVRQFADERERSGVLLSALCSRRSNSGDKCAVLVAHQSPALTSWLTPAVLNATCQGHKLVQTVRWRFKPRRVPAFEVERSMTLRPAKSVGPDELALT